jgi:titin
VNGQTYSFYVVANSLAGSSLAASVRATPIGVPTAPQQVSVVAGNASAVISFSPPTFNGGSSVTRYVVSDGLGDTCWKAAAGSCRISGLTNGQSYTFTVVAINAAGTSSGTSAAAMPAGPPSRPTAVIAVPSNGKALISWDAPPANGSPVQSYSVTSGAGQNCTTTLTSCVVYGLRNGQSYQFSVRAMNALGTSNASDPSNPVTPAAPPTAPQNLAVSPGDGTATFTWNAPQSTNGAAVASYRVSDGVDFCETSAKTCTVSGLINGQTYLFVAYATNSAGIPLASQIVQVVPATVSAAPTVSSVTSVATGLEVAFVAPAVNGGAPVTSYLVSVNGGVTFAPVSSKSLTGSLLHLTGLTPGATYSVALKAVNSAGASPSSLAVSGNYVTTANAPKIVAVTSQKTSMVVRYSAPTSNGGTAIVAYQYSLDGGATWKLASYGTPSTINITGLSSRTTYRLELRAVNSAGIGSASSVKVVRTA